MTSKQAAGWPFFCFGSEIHYFDAKASLEKKFWLKMHPKIKPMKKYCKIFLNIFCWFSNWICKSIYIWNTIDNVTANGKISSNFHLMVQWRSSTTMVIRWKKRWRKKPHGIGSVNSELWFENYLENDAIKRREIIVFRKSAA